MSFEIPLFPLNTVLFPGVSLPLHIFEERYRLMVQRCLDHGREFGVVLIADGNEVGAPAVPRDVGTIARILHVDCLDDGRMNLMSHGEERFQLFETWETEGYLQGRVEVLADSPDEPDDLRLLAMKAHALFDRYGTVIMPPSDVRPLAKSLPDDPARLSFLVAAALPISLARKQTLLEMTSAGKRLQLLCGILKEQITVREVIERARPRLPAVDQQIGGFFSPN